MKKTFLSLIFLLFFAFFLKAQTPEWKSYQNTNIGITNMDFYGSHLWLGTNGAVIDFDTTTHQFTVYDQDNGIYQGQNYVGYQQLVVDKYGYVWREATSTLQVSDGLGGWKTPLPSYKNLRIDPKKDSVVWLYKDISGGKKYYKFTSNTFPNPIDSLILPSNGLNINDFEIDINHEAWTIQQDTLWRYNGTNWQSITYKIGLNSGTIIPTFQGDMYILHKDSLYTLVGNNLVFTWTHYPPFNNSFKFNHTDANNNIWFTGDSSIAHIVYKFNGVSADTLHFSYNFSDVFREDANAHLWAARFYNDYDYTKGIIRQNGQSWTKYNVSNYPQMNTFYATIAVNTQNEIWLGGYGAVKSDGVNIIVDSTSNVGYGPVRYIVDKNNRMWLQTTMYYAVDFPPTPVSYWDNAAAAWIDLTCTSFQSVFNTSRFTIDSSLNVWISSYEAGALFKYDGTSWQTFNTNNSQLPSFNVGDIATRLNQEIWGTTRNSWMTGTGQSVFSIPPNGGAWTIYNTTNSPLTAADFSYPITFYMDRLNNVWIHGYQNFYKFDGTNWFTYPYSMFGQISYTYYRNIMQDAQFNYWICTQTDLVKWDGNTSITHYPANGFWSPNFIEEDHNHNKWIGTNNGIYTFNENGIVTSPVAISSSKVVAGNYFYDANQNKIKDANEYGIPTQKVEQTPDSVNLYSDMQGNYACYTPANMVHTFTAKPNTPFAITTDSLSYTVFVDTTNILGRDFGIFLPNPLDSAEIEIFSAYAPRCNMARPLILQYTNRGNTTLSGEIRWLPDSQMTFISANPPANQILNDTLIFTFSNLAPFQTAYINLNYMLPGPNIVISQYADIQASSFGNYTQLDSDLLDETIKCAFDPNDKTAYAQGYHQENVSLFKDELQYLVRFQNTGNDVAYNILVSDTLENDFDISTFRLIGASHTVFTELYEAKRVVNFRFNHIYLPDSNANEPASHGYVTFGIKSKANLADSTEVNNQAAIYFDYNPPIFTNTTQNFLVDSLQIPMNTTAISPENVTFSVKIFPNPVSESLHIRFENTELAEYEAIVMDLQGRVLQTQKAKTTHFEFSTATLTDGMYVICLNGKQNFVDKFCVKH